MRFFLLIFFYLLTFSVYSQHSTLITSTDTVEVKINAHSSSILYTTGGNVEYAKIKQIIFHEKPSEALSGYLKKKNIQYLFEGKSKETLTSFVDKSKKLSIPSGNEELYINLGKFNKSRKSGKWMQVMGTIVSGAAIAAGENEIALGGTALAFAGFVVDISASKHLDKYENIR